MSSTPEASQLAPEDVIVTSRGPVVAGVLDQAREQVAHLSRFSRRDVQGATVVLTELTNPAIAEPSRAEVTFNIAGIPLRAESTAPTMTQALDGVVARLERRIVDQMNRWDDRSRWVSARDGDGNGDGRREQVLVPPDERDVVRRKTFAAAPSTAQEAVFDMEALEHDFHLFTDVETGAPALVRRRSDGSYAVAGLPEGAAGTESLFHDPAPPTLDEAAARERLDASGEPFVFYLDAGTDQGSVVYLRYDGHYGVITVG